MGFISTRAQAKIKNALGLINWSTTNYPLAKKALVESLELFQAIGDQVGTADSLHMLGHVALDSGRHSEAKDYFNRCAALYRHLNDKIMLLVLVGDLGLIAYLDLEYDLADKLFKQQLELARSINNKDNIASALNHLGDLARCAGENDRARGFYQESLELIEGVGDLSAVNSLRFNLAHVVRNKGDFQTAMHQFVECLTKFYANDDKKGVIECMEGIAETGVGMACFAKAAQLFGACENLRIAFQVQWWPANHIAYEKGIQELKEKFSPDLLRIEWDKGCVLTLEEAVSLALNFG